MSRARRRLLVAVLALVGGLAVVLVVLTVLLFAVGPSATAACGDRSVDVSAALGERTEAQIDAFGGRLDEGQSAALTLDESEISSAALTFLRTDRIRDVVVCFSATDAGGEAEARLRFDVPVLPDRTVRLRGDVGLDGLHPVVRLRDLDLGALGVLVGLGLKSAVEDAVNDELARLFLVHSYAIAFGDGALALTGEP
jgi:hypothetical protein